MRYFVLDTNFILIHLRDSTQLQPVFELYRLREDDAMLLVSVVTIAELLSLAQRRQWGDARKHILNSFLQEIFPVDIHHGDHRLLTAYASIDSFSLEQGR